MKHSYGILDQHNLRHGVQRSKSGSLSGIRVEEEVDSLEWDRFVASNPGGTLFHTFAWRGIIQKQGLRPLYLAAKDSQGDIVGLYPLFLTPMFSGLAQGLVSLPFCHVGGPLLDRRAHPKVLSALMNSLRWEGLVKRVLVISTTVKDPWICDALSNRGASISSNSGIFEVDLHERPLDQIWASVFTDRDGQRKKIRKLEKLGFISTLARDTTDLPKFYELYARTVRRAGGLPRPYSLISDIWSAFHPKYFKILLVRWRESVMAGAGFFCYPEKATLYLYYAAYSERLQGFPGALLLFATWKVLEWARDNGYRRVDFGTTPADPADGKFRFKSQFGGKFVRRYAIKHALLPVPALSLLRKANRVIGPQWASRRADSDF